MTEARLVRSGSTDVRREQLLMIKALKRYVTNSKRGPAGENRLDFRHWIRDFPTRISLSGIAWTLTAVVLISIGLPVFWRLVQTRKDTQSLVQTRKDTQSLDHFSEPGGETPQNSQRDVETLLTLIKHEREQREQAEARAQALQTQLNELQKARQNVPINELLSPVEREKRESKGTIQSEFNPYWARFSIPSTKPFWLKLDIREHDKFPEYSIELINQQGRTVAKKRGLKPVDSGYLSFALSSSVMQTGEYNLLLYGRRGESKQKLGEYEMYVRVTR